MGDRFLLIFPPATTCLFSKETTGIRWFFDRPEICIFLWCVDFCVFFGGAEIPPLTTGDRLVVNLARMRGDYFITPFRPSGYRKVEYYTLIIRAYWLDKMKNTQTENITNCGP